MTLDAWARPPFVAGNPRAAILSAPDRDVGGRASGRRALGRSGSGSRVRPAPCGGRTSGAVTGEGMTFAVSVVQPIEFGWAHRAAPCDRRWSGWHWRGSGFKQFDATLAARAPLAGLWPVRADEKARRAQRGRADAHAGARDRRTRSGRALAQAGGRRARRRGAIGAERTAAAADAEANTILYELNQLRGAPFTARIRIVRPDMALPLCPRGRRWSNRRAQTISSCRRCAPSSRSRVCASIWRASRASRRSASGPYFDRARSDIRETNYGDAPFRQHSALEPAGGRRRGGTGQAGAGPMRH